MAALSGNKVRLTLSGILQSPSGIGSGNYVQDGAGNSSALKLNSTTINVLTSTYGEFDITFANNASITIPSGKTFTINGHALITGNLGISGTLTATLTGDVIGDVTGNVTGNVTGTSGSTTGNAATVTNGVYTTGTYSNPSWITGLAASKITGTFTSPSIGTNIKDANGNVIIGLISTANAVNQITLTNQSTGSHPVISATGSDSNVYIILQPKGTGGVAQFGTATSPASYQFYEQTTNGSNFINITAPTALAGNRTFTLPDTDVSCFVAQRVSTQTGAVATGTTVLPFDDTIPQNTEGDQYMSLSITPKNIANILKIEIVVFAAHSATAGNLVSAALFQDTTVGALAAHAGSNAGNFIGLKFTHTMVAGTISTTTFKVRAGCNTAATTTFNGTSSARIFGGVMSSGIIITEYST